VISINSSFSSTAGTTDRSVVSLCLPGVSDQGIGLSGIPAVRPESSASRAGLPVREREQRPTKALEAVEARAQAYAFTAAGANNRKQTTQYHLMWAFRGPEPWSDPV
jgi:hypothetical protein